MSGDDVWGSDSSEGEGLQREWTARRGEHWSSGYREGVEAGKHETVQEGFNQGEDAKAACARVLWPPQPCPPPHGVPNDDVLHAGYVQGAAAGFECGAARGAAATLRALDPRLPPDLRAPLEAQHQQQQQQQGSQQQLGDVPYQQLQQQVCESIMAAAPQPADGAPDGGTTAAPQPSQLALPLGVASAVQASRASIQLLGLQPPAQRQSEV